MYPLNSSKKQRTCSIIHRRRPNVRKNESNDTAISCLSWDQDDPTVGLEGQLLLLPAYREPYVAYCQRALHAVGVGGVQLVISSRPSGNTSGKFSRNYYEARTKKKIPILIANRFRIAYLHPPPCPPQAVPAASSSGHNLFRKKRTRRGKYASHGCDLHRASKI